MTEQSALFKTAKPDHGTAIKVKNVGPIAEFAVTLHPGVNVLTGPNGIGKTTITDAIGQAYGVVPGRLNVRDGTAPDSAMVTVDGDVAMYGKKAGAIGDRSANAAPRSALVDFLTGGGLTDPKRANAAQIKALADLVPDMQHATAEDVAALIGDAPGIDPARYIGRPVLDVVELVKAALQEQARMQEKLRDEANGSIATTTARLGALKTPDARPPESADAPPVRDAEHALSEARQRLDLVREQAARRADLERVAGTRGERPDVNAAREELDGLTEARIDAEGDLREAQRRLSEAQAAESVAVAAHNSALKAAEQWDRQAEALAGIDSLPDAAQVQAAQEALQAAQERADLAERASAYLAAENAATGEREALTGTLARVETEAKTASEKADKLRAADKEIAKRLSTLLATKGLPAGLTVKDGRVHATLDGQEVPFSGEGRHLSEGQQIKVLIDLARIAYPGRLIILDPAWWAALSPSMQALVGAQCAEAGMIAITSRPTDTDAIGVEVVGGGE